MDLVNLDNYLYELKIQREQSKFYPSLDAKRVFIYEHCTTGTAAPPAFPALWTAINPYPTAFPYGNGMVLHFYQQQDSSTTKTVHKVINKGLKTYV